MLCNIKDFPNHCETCKKHNSTPILSEPVTVLDDSEPYEQYAIKLLVICKKKLRQKTYCH